MSSIFVPPHVRGNKGQVTQETIQKLLDENGHLIQCIVDHQSSGNIRESAQYQQVLHRNLVWLATVADSSQTGNQQISSPKQGIAGTLGSPKASRGDNTSSLPPPPMTDVSMNPPASQAATPKLNGMGSNPPTPQPPYASPQPHRSSPQIKPTYNPQQGPYPPQYHHSPNSSGTRTPMRSPVDPSQNHSQVQRQSPMAPTPMASQYPSQQQQPINNIPNQPPPPVSYSQSPASFQQPSTPYTDHPTSYPSSSSYTPQASYQQSNPVSLSQTPGYSQNPSQYPQHQQHPSYPQQQQSAPYGPQPGPYTPNASVGSQGPPPNNYPQGPQSQSQFPASSHQGMMQSTPRPYYGRPGPPAAPGGYPGYSSTAQNHQMPPPEQQQMYQQAPPPSSYPQQYPTQQPHQGMPFQNP